MHPHNCEPEEKYPDWLCLLIILGSTVLSWKVIFFAMNYFSSL